MSAIVYYFCTEDLGYTVEVIKPVSLVIKMSFPYPSFASSKWKSFWICFNGIFCLEEKEVWEAWEDFSERKIFTSLWKNGL